MRREAIVFVAALALAPPGAQAADLVVWWQSDSHAQEDGAVAEIIAAFEQETGKQVDLVQPAQGETIKKAQAALEAGQPPDFLFALTAGLPAAQWAYEGRLADLEAALNLVLDRRSASRCSREIPTGGSAAWLDRQRCAGAGSCCWPERAVA